MISYEKVTEFIGEYPHYSQPWTDGGKTVVTDSRIMLVVDQMFPETPKPLEGIRYPDYRRLFVEAQNKTEVLGVSEVKIEKVEKKCEICNGAGSWAECDECGGTGIHECDCGNKHECRKCQGTGHGARKNVDPSLLVKCEDCDGKGKYFEYKHVRLGKVLFRGDLIEKVMSLPGFRNLRTDPEKPMFPCVFDFDGGVGVIMPMSQ